MLPFDVWLPLDLYSVLSLHIKEIGSIAFIYDFDVTRCTSEFDTTLVIQSVSEDKLLFVIRPAQNDNGASVTLIIVWQGLGRLYELCSIVAVAPLPARNSFLAILLLFFMSGWLMD